MTRSVTVRGHAWRRRARVGSIARLVSAVLLAAAVLTGCSMIGGPAPSPAATRASSSAAPQSPVASAPADGGPTVDGATSAAEVRGAGVPVTSGEVTVWVLGHDASQTPVPDGAVTITLTVPAASTTVARLAVAEDLVATGLLDGSVVLSDASGRPVGGLSAPELDASALDAPSDLTSAVARLAVTGDMIDLVLTPATTSTDVTASVQLGTTAIASTAWGEHEGGRSLAVVPTKWLRGGTLAAQQLGWAQLVAADPEVDTGTMRDQFDCHALGARDKTTWNLEPWRPDVGALSVLAARCNPT